jgi:hypothetical protein
MFIKDYTVGLATMMGPSKQKGLDFMAFLDPRQKAGFLQFVLDEVESMHIGDVEKLGAHRQIDIYPPHMKSAKLFISADATLVIQNHSDGLYVVTSLHNLVWRQGRKKGKSRGPKQTQPKKGVSQEACDISMRVMAELTLDVSMDRGFAVQHMSHQASPSSFDICVGQSFLEWIDRADDFEKKVCHIAGQVLKQRIVPRHINKPLGVYPLRPITNETPISHVDILLKEWKVDDDEELSAIIQLRSPSCDL